MFKHFLRFLYFGVALSSTAQADDQINVFMAGDSTMSIKEVKDYPETGWGMPFQYFFNDQVQVINLAKNGRSTRTFKSEGRWQMIMDEIKPGDYVIIQFGHNDQSKQKVDRYTPVPDFKENLLGFIKDVREKQAYSLLMTPITRRYFNEDGTIKETHPLYADAVRDVAKQTKVDFIDMEAITKRYFQALGDDGSALRFMHIAPDLHPNYPLGVTDDTHLNQLGATEVAQLVLTEFKKMKHPLLERVRKPDSKHLMY